MFLEKGAPGRYEYFQKRYEYGKSTNEYWFTELCTSIFIYFDFANSFSEPFFAAVWKNIQ
jgi:hypothetical protein